MSKGRDYCVGVFFVFLCWILFCRCGIILEAGYPVRIPLSSLSLWGNRLFGLVTELFYQVRLEIIVPDE